MHFTGIAEVEYKWDAVEKEYKLIEINPRPWDQHRLGQACGCDLIYLAYCEHAGLAMPLVAPAAVGQKWIAEDAFFMAALRLLWRRDVRIFSLIRQARGERIYAIWSWKDPIPLVAYLVARFIPGLIGAGLRFLGAALKKRNTEKRYRHKEGQIYERQLERRKSVS